MIFLQDQLCKVYRDDQIVFCAVKKGKLINVTFSEFIQKVNAMTDYLKAWGLEKGNKVVTSLNHGFEWNIIEQAIFRLGAIHVPLAPDYSESELVEKTKLIEPKLLIANTPYHFKKLGRANLSQSPQIPILIYPTDISVQTIQDKESSIHFNEKDIAVILFTSGSSERSKAVPLSYSNILTSILEFSATDLFDDIDSCLDILHHSFSGGRKVNYSAQLRGLKIMYANSTLSIADNIDFYKPDMVTCVPYLALQILEHLRSKSKPCSIRKIICGGASISKETVIEFEKYGIKVYNVYGLTETASLCAYNTDRNYRLGSVGKISPKMDYKLNEKGELLLKGDSIFNGYYTPTGVENASDEDGWFNTGDIAEVDQDGFLFLLGRSKGQTKSEKGKFVN